MTFSRKWTMDVVLPCEREVAWKLKLPVESFKYVGSVKYMKPNITFTNYKLVI